jgi:hypothetical protein
MTVIKVEPFDRDEFVDAAARAMFVSAWADAMEEAGRSEEISGVELYDVAPDTPAEARKAARALSRAYEQANGKKLKSLWKLAVTVPGKHYREPDLEDFGYSLAMQSLGHGVGWEDNHPAFGLVTPRAEFYLTLDGDDADMWWEVAEVSSPARANPARKGKAMARNGRVLGQIGDVNPIDFGGGVVSLDADRRATLEYTYGVETEYPAETGTGEGIEHLTLQVYQVDLGSDGDEFLSDLDWVDWPAVASFTGMDVAELRQGARSKKALTRALVAADVGSFFGFSELDQYPAFFTVAELERRWFPQGSLAKTV